MDSVYVDNIELVLFFDNYTAYDPTELAVTIKNNLKSISIGAPIVSPPQDDIPTNYNRPFVSFTQNNEIGIFVNFRTARLVLYGSYLEKQKDIIDRFYDIFSKFHFCRIGYNINRYLPAEDKEYVRNDLLSQIGHCEDFQLSWLKYVKINNHKINLWERYISDEATFPGVLHFLDYNTMVDDPIDIKKDFIHKFIKECQKHSLEETEKIKNDK